MLLPGSGRSCQEKAPIRPWRDACSSLQLGVPFRRLWSCRPRSVLEVRRLGPAPPLPQLLLLTKRPGGFPSPSYHRCYASTVMVAGGGSNEGPLSEEPIHSFVHSSCDMSSIPQAPQRQQWFNCFSRPAGAVQTQKEGRGLQAVNPRRAGAERHQSAVHSGHGGAAGTPLGRHRLCWEGSERL